MRARMLGSSPAKLASQPSSFRLFPMLRFLRSPLSLSLLGAALALSPACSPSQSIPVDNGEPLVVTLTPLSGEALVVQGPSEIPTGTHILPPVSGQEEMGVLRVVGQKDMTLDLRGVVFEAAAGALPAEGVPGRGIVLEDCDSITIVGGVLRGYTTPITVRNSKSIRLREVQIEGFWREALESTVTRDSGADWLEPGKFLEEGWGGMQAGIEVYGSTDVVVQGCRARQGAIGLVLNETKDALVVGNDFSFLSAFGVVVAGGRDHTIAHNSLEYNVRGYSHGSYASGQESAGLLVVGNSQNNRLAFNRLTHCGSGISLFGVGIQAPVHNRLYGNDCRHAIFAGVKSFNSRDTLVQNNDLSAAGRFGMHSEADVEIVLLDNEAADVTGTGIGLFSSSKGSLLQNRVLRNQIGLEIAWSQSDARASVGGASKDHHVLGNRFEGNGQDLVARDSQALVFAGNQFIGERQRLHTERIQAYVAPDEDQSTRPAEDTVVGWLAGSNGVSPSGNLMGVSLKLWDGEMPGPLKLAQSLDAPRVLGYPTSEGRVVSEYEGGLETVVLGLYGPWDFPSGEPQTQMRQPGGILGGIRWQARWFSFEPETQDPRGDIEAWRQLAENPILRRTVDHFLDPRPGEEIQKRVPPVRFGLIAEGQLEIPSTGSYRLSVASDDGIRVWIGDRLVFEDWTWNATRNDGTVIDLEAGSTPIRLEYFQLDGASELILELHHEHRQR